MERGTLLTGTDVDGYPVKLFCPATEAGDLPLRTVSRRMSSVRMTLNFAVSREAIEADLAQASR